MNHFLCADGFSLYIIIIIIIDFFIASKNSWATINVFNSEQTKSGYAKISTISAKFHISKFE